MTDSDPRTGPDEPRADQPAASDILGAALGSAARQAGLDPAAEASTGHVVWRAMGGWRGVLESVLPSLAFLVIYTVWHELLPALLISVGLALVFTVIRLAMKSPPAAAIGGLVATGAAAALALWTGRAQDNFVWGFITNGAYGTAHNGFFTSPDGTEHWLVYHATTNPNGSCWTDRTTRIQPFTWHDDGRPNFGTPLPLSADILAPAGE